MTRKKKTSAAKKAAGAKPQAKAPSIKERTKIFKGDLLRDEYDLDHLKRNNLFENTVRRKSRHWCFKIRQAIIDDRLESINPPDGWKEFVEGLPGFAGWEHFAVSWDLHGTNPFMIVLRLQSVWDDWDAVMRRVAIPIDAPPEQIHDRIQALTDEYARKEAKKR